MNLRIPTLAALAGIQVLASSCGGGGVGSSIVEDSAVGNDLASAVRGIIALNAGDDADLFRKAGADLATVTVTVGVSEPFSETLVALASAKPTEGSESQSSVSQSSNSMEIDVNGVMVTITADSVAVSGLDDVYRVFSDDSLSDEEDFESSLEKALEEALNDVTIAVSGPSVDMTLGGDEATTTITVSHDISTVTISTTAIKNENNNELSAASVLVAYNLPGGTDWAAIGVWLNVADKTSDNWNFGVFADTSTPFTGRLLSGSLKYEGTSVGYAVTKDVSSDDPDNFYEFTADAFLEADFENINTINGRIENLHSPGEDDFNTDIAENFVVVLEDATINVGNFFNGNVVVENEQIGYWGGRFFGEGAEGVLGTYGGSLNNNDHADFFVNLDLEEFSFAGAFLAVEE